MFIAVKHLPVFMLITFGFISSINPSQGDRGPKGVQGEKGGKGQEGPAGESVSLMILLFSVIIQCLNDIMRELHNLMYQLINKS